jgi:tRNA(fMet)-specific endonuclease VapC
VALILDTNALSAAADDDATVVAILRKADQISLPVVALGEYRYGILQSRHRIQYENWLQDMIQDCQVLEIDEETTRHYANIRLDLRKGGKSIPTNDLWIAALCRQYGLSLLSRDTHFDALADITRIGW